MNKIVLSIFSLFMVMSCTWFKYDNYDGPDASINGAIVDQNGVALQVEDGGGARIKMLDYGYSDNPQEFYLNVKGDGTFINTKIFASTYTIVAEGPFVPLIQVDESSNVIVDNSLKNVTKKDFKDIVFHVEPYLSLEWVGEPVVNDDGTISVRFKFDRGTDNTAFHKPIKDVTLFINTVQYVGNGGFDKYSSTVVKGGAANLMLGMINEMTTTLDAAHPLEKGRPYYIRVGARMDYPGVWGGDNYNYTTVKKVIIPKE